MDEEYVEIYEQISDTPVPIFVGTFGNWEKAIEEAGKRPRVEILVVSERTGMVLVVYSDDGNVGSSSWWANEVRKARRFFGN